MKIPGLSFSLKRALGVTAVKQKIAKKTGIPLTKQGMERKVGGAEYQKLVAEAKAITNDMDKRYAAFAKAEALLLEHAFALPIHTSSRSYQMSKLNVFESQYAPFGIAYLRYKDQHLYNDSMSLEEFNKAYTEWKAKLG